MATSCHKCVYIDGTLTAIAVARGSRVWPHNARAVAFWDCDHRTNGRVVSATLVLLKSRQRASVLECSWRAGMLKSVIICSKTFNTTGGAISTLTTPRKHEGNEYTLPNCWSNSSSCRRPNNGSWMFFFVGRSLTTGRGFV